MSPQLLLLFLLLLHIAILPSLQLSHVDLAALADIKASLTDIPGSDFFSSWDITAPDPCSSFSGVTCSLSRVSTLTLGTGLSGSPGLAGSLSPSIANLTSLTQLILFPGLVTGPIPPQIGQLTGLRVISLTNNRLTGTIPSSFSSLNNLHTLDLSFNQLNGEIPPGLTRLQELKVLILAANSLSGELLGVWTQLLHLDLRKNKLTGPLRSLPLTLRYVALSDNLLTGPLNSLQSLSELVYLDLSMNKFNGTIPAELFSPSSSSMFLQRNNLSGGLPSKLVGSTSYGEGSILDLSHNFLTGELSPVLAGVESLFLNNNHLTGVVPEEYIQSVSDGTTKTLFLQHNYLSKFPSKPGLVLPDAVSLCLKYNCMAATVMEGLMSCPASAGEQMSRPASQCSGFNDHNSID
ncbi:leucine-rich repeat receptor-like serine/threonine-protein kinase BAM2 [Mangifera indica]|uniref:leucine-rich repeat receptor-like serine/threonine-protein kinase BAM2 n=1 Tax=Mangifera indica TaxID=29780 RepID=UPI001CFA9A78|nr:leucine-rich repeat receptor-like serine/threonine-protein kinase BAM2 [Mangifera indica]